MYCSLKFHPIDSWSKNWCIFSPISKGTSSPSAAKCHSLGSWHFTTILGLTPPLTVMLSGQNPRNAHNPACKWERSVPAAATRKLFKCRLRSISCRSTASSWRNRSNSASDGNSSRVGPFRGPPWAIAETLGVVELGPAEIRSSIREPMINWIFKNCKPSLVDWYCKCYLNTKL